MTKDEHDGKSIGVTDFKAHCLALIDEVAKGKTRRVVLTKHNRPVAEIVPLSKSKIELWGAMAGSVKVAPGVDLTAGTGEEWDAES